MWGRAPVAVFNLGVPNQKRNNYFEYLMLKIDKYQKDISTFALAFYD
jgi:hypothetical protein